jgi:hypothetical protein
MSLVPPGPYQHNNITTDTIHFLFGSAPLQGLLIIEAPRSHPDTPQSVRLRRRDLYLTTHNIHMRQTSMPLAGFEPTIPASVRPQTHAVDRADTGIGITIHVFDTLLFFTILIMRGYNI